MLMPRCAIGVLTAGLMAVEAGSVCGQDYPNKTIRIVTGESSGSTDFTARLVAQGISVPLGQPVIVENRAGGGGVYGEIVARANPDGYTLLIAGGSFWIATLFRKTSYDPVKDFSPITMLTNSPNILAVHPSVPAKSVKELIALAKAKPGVLNYANSAVGGATHLASELFKMMAGVDIVNIPFKGGSSSVLGLISGQVQMMFMTAASATPHLKSGKIRALAVTSANPSALAPGLPTVAATVPGYESGGVVAMFAPPKTPASIVNRLNREVVKLLSQADSKEQLFNLGVETVGNSPAQLGATVKSDLVTWGKVIKEAGIRLD